MEKVNRILITKKEAKELKRIQRVFEIMGFDFEAIESRILSLENSIVNKDEQIASLKHELAASKEANEKFISDKMREISVNIQKSQANTVLPAKSFSFEGKKINEKY